MIENVRAVSNPLTVIALFAGLAEVAGAGVMPFVNPALQGIFLWYVMGFPVALVGCFFLTLNFNSRALYAPRDFRDDVSYLRSMELGHRLSRDLAVASAELDAAKAQLNELASQKDDVEKLRVLTALEARISGIQTSVEGASEAAADELAVRRRALGSIAEGILLQLAGKQSVSNRDLVQLLEASPETVSRTLARLAERGLIERRIAGRAALYSLTEAGKVQAETARRSADYRIAG